MFTEQNCKDVGICLGMSEPESLVFYHHYNAQGWLYPSAIKITNLKSAMWRWKNNGYKEVKKQKLYPIKGKFCGTKINGHVCGMPAKQKIPGDYENYRCMEHATDKFKAEYK